MLENVCFPSNKNAYEINMKYIKFGIDYKFIIEVRILFSYL